MTGKIVEVDKIKAHRIKQNFTYSFESEKEEENMLIFVCVRTYRPVNC